MNLLMLCGKSHKYFVIQDKDNGLQCLANIELLCMQVMTETTKHIKLHLCKVVTPNQIIYRTDNFSQSSVIVWEPKARKSGFMDRMTKNSRQDSMF